MWLMDGWGSKYSAVFRVPGIEDCYPRRLHVARIRGRERQTMLQRRGRQLGVDRQDGQPALFDRSFDLPPPFGHGIVERENASRKANADIVIEPTLP